VIFREHKFLLDMPFSRLPLWIAIFWVAHLVVVVKMADVSEEPLSSGLKWALRTLFEPRERDEVT
jgi:hypothetical protein